MKFEVEVSQDDTGQWLATAVEYKGTATGRTEKEALARVMEALAAHIKKAARGAARSRACASSTARGSLRAGCGPPSWPSTAPTSSRARTRAAAIRCARGWATAASSGGRPTRGASDRSR